MGSRAVRWRRIWLRASRIVHGRVAAAAVAVDAVDRRQAGASTRGCGFEGVDRGQYDETKVTLTEPWFGGNAVNLRCLCRSEGLTGGLDAVVSGRVMRVAVRQVVSGYGAGSWRRWWRDG